MWKYKNEEEIMKIRQKKKNAYKKIWRPLIFALFLLLVLVIIMKIGLPRAANPVFHPVTWKDFFEDELPRIFWFGLIMLILSYAEQIISKRLIFSEPDVMMCLKCSQVKNDDKNCKCACGGEIVPLDELEWIEEKAGSKSAE